MRDRSARERRARTICIGGTSLTRHIMPASRQPLGSQRTPSPPPPRAAHQKADSCGAWQAGGLVLRPARQGRCPGRAGGVEPRGRRAVGQVATVAGQHGKSAAPAYMGGVAERAEAAASSRWLENVRPGARRHQHDGADSIGPPASPITRSRTSAGSLPWRTGGASPPAGMGASRFSTGRAAAGRSGPNRRRLRARLTT